jgi:hypothetical protein
LAAALDVSPETIGLIDRGYRKAHRVIAKLVACGFIGQAQAEQLQHAAEVWLAERRLQAKREVLETCKRS